MLEGYGDHLRAIQDSAPLKPGSRGNSVTTLDKLASNLSFSIDTVAVTSELQSSAEPESRVRLLLSTFEPIEPHWYPEGYTLAESLCSAIARRASWIQEVDRSLRNHGTQYGATVGAKENVRLQFCWRNGLPGRRLVHIANLRSLVKSQSTNCGGLSCLRRTIRKTEAAAGAPSGRPWPRC